MDTQKEALYQRCLSTLTTRVEDLQQRIRSIQESKHNETKSSAGDKYETGRAMMQMEEDKITAQLDVAKHQLHTLSQIDIAATYPKVQLGALIQTSKRFYFLSVSLGKIVIGDQVCFCISADAPIGQQLWAKGLGDSIAFNGFEEEITMIY